MARIPLPTRDSLTDDAERERWDRTVGENPIDVRRMLFMDPSRSGKHIWASGALDPRSRELVILRAAFRKQSVYEWHQHVRISRREGLSDADIDGVRDWRASSIYTPAERALLAYVDALADGPRPDDATFAAIAEGRTPAEIVGLTQIITEYFQLAHMMAALDLEPEKPFVGWDILSPRAT